MINRQIRRVIYDVGTSCRYNRSLPGLHESLDNQLVCTIPHCHRYLNVNAKSTTSFNSTKYIASFSLKCVYWLTANRTWFIVTGSRVSRVFRGVCVFVCLFFYTISQKPMQLVSPDLTYIDMVHNESWKSIYFGVKRWKVKVTKHKNIAGMGHGALGVLTSSSFNYSS